MKQTLLFTFRTQSTGKTKEQHLHKLATQTGNNSPIIATALSSTTRNLPACMGKTPKSKSYTPKDVQVKHLNVPWHEITGSNQQQWRLLLEEKKSNFYWPFNSDTEITTYNSGKGLPVAEKVPLTDDKNADQRPHRLSKFESGTFLTPQCGDGRNLVSAYNSSSCLLQVLEGDLDRMHLFSYKVPPDCENIILSDKLIFATSKNQPSNQHVLKIISRKFAEISSENSKK
ncbi:hypothetical protein AVEN_145645-1, partial [Araneus ventricosus]